MILFRWWQIYTGDMMAIPLSAIRKYTPEIIALSVVAIVLGAFWSIVDTYQPSYLLDLTPSNASNGALDSSNATEFISSTIPSIVEVDLKPDVPSEVNEIKTEVDNEFAIGAPKIIKFVLTGKFDPIKSIRFNHSVQVFIWWLILFG